jgi:hypothetical protein
MLTKYDERQAQIIMGDCVSLAVYFYNGFTSDITKLK